jgi:hypothetical protein
MEQLQVNKWIRMVLGAATMLLAWLASYNWSDLVSAQTATFIVGGIGLVQTIIAGIAPGPKTPVAPVTKGGLKGLIFSHRSVKRGDPYGTAL